MEKIFEKLWRIKDSLEGRLINIATSCFASGLVLGDIYRAIENENYALAISEAVLGIAFGIHGYQEGRNLKSKISLQ